MARCLEIRFEGTCWKNSRAEVDKSNNLAQGLTGDQP